MAWLVLLLAIICNIAAWISWQPIFIMNDGIQYLSTATNWLQGHGFSTHSLIYNPHFQGRLPAPQTVWPPGFPALLALAGMLGANLESAALMINLAASALSGWLVWLILRQCYFTRPAALCCAALFYFTTASWHLAIALLSESLFTLLILAALYCLPAQATTPRRMWLLCGSFVGAAITVRYSGVFSAAAFALGAATMLLFSGQYRTLDVAGKVTRLGLLLGPPALAFAGLMIRTHSLVGSIDRNTGVGSQQSVAETIRAFAEESSILIGFRDGWILSGDSDTWLFLLFAALAAIVALLALRIRLPQWLIWHRDKPLVAADPGHSYRAAVTLVVAIHAAAFGAYLAWCSLSHSPLNVTPRYLYQIYPGVFLLFCLLAGAALQTSTSAAGAMRLLRPATACLAMLYIIAQVNLIPVIREFSKPAVEIRDVVELAISDHIRVADVVRACVGDPASATESAASSLWTPSGVRMHYHTGAYTITLPPIYTTPNFDFERLKADIDTYNIGLFLFVNNHHSQAGEYGQMLASIKSWLTENQYPELALALPATSASPATTINLFAVDGECLKPAPQR